MLNLFHKISFPKNPNQSRQVTVLTVTKLDSALRFCAARFTNFITSQNLDLQNVYDEIEMVCIR